jgi:hypothetical protein
VEDLEEPEVWQEDEAAQVSTSLTWVSSPSFADELALARIPHRFVYTWLQRQLKVSGTEWEKKQQKAMLDTGNRHYRILKAFDSKDTEELFQNITELMFDEGRWLLLHRHDERVQLQAFVTISRCIAMAHQLVYCRNKNYPYKTFDALRDDSQFQQLQEYSACELDGYTANLVDFYGTRLGNPMSRSELELALALGDTDTNSTERIHSVNNRKLAGRSLTHKLDLATMSAHYVGRHARGPTAIGKDDVPASTGSGSKRPLLQGGAQAKPKKKRGGGGAWRAILHITAEGQQFDVEYMAHLSHRFHNLSDMERDYYNELGMLGTNLHRSRGNAFEKRTKVRKRAASAPTKFGLLLPGSQQLEVADGEGEVALAAHSSALSGQETIYLSAKEVLAAERGKVRARQRLQNSIVKDVEAICDRDGTGLAQSFGLDSTGRAAVLPMQGSQLHWYVPTATVLDNASKYLATSTLEASTWDWRSGHRCIMHRDCEPLGKVPTHRRLCWEAQGCVHKGDGRLLHSFQSAVIQQDRRLKKHLGDKMYKLLMCMRGRFVMRLRVPLDDCGDHLHVGSACDEGRDGDEAPRGTSDDDVFGSGGDHCAEVAVHSCSKLYNTETPVSTQPRAMYGETNSHPPFFKGQVVFVDVCVVLQGNKWR